MAAETQDTDGEWRWSHLKKVIAFAREHAEETGETVAAHMVGEIQKMMTGIEMDFPIGTGEAPAVSPANDWRLAEGAAPRLEGDDLSPEEAIRLGRGHEPAASPKKGGDWMVKWPPPAAHLQTQQVFETEREAHHWVRMNVASWTRDIGYEVCPVSSEPTPNSETEDLPHTLGGPEISVDIGALELRAQVRALLEALEKIADVENWQLPGDEIGKGCVWCMDYEHTPNCPVRIARTALAEGN